jgi:serine/threonine-protein kinase
MSFEARSKSPNSEEHVDQARTGLRLPAADPVIGRCLGGKLLVEERLGKGALGVVYRAKHVLLPQPVAVKVLHPQYQEDPEFRARFLAEAQAASVLDHPNLVRVIDFGEQWGGFMWLAMELLEGRSLERVFAEEGRLPVARAVDVMLDVCAGLAHAHERGIVHGDIKPSNVILVPRVDDDDGMVTERAKLCDFGLARGGMYGGGLDSGSRPAIGSPAYMSPEQALGEDLDARSDVYSCGALFYELVTGEPPFAGAERGAVLREHVLPPSWMPSAKRSGIDTRVDAIVRKALAKNPADRFASMRELRAALRDLSGGLELPAQAVPAVPMTPWLGASDAAASDGTGGASVRSDIREVRDPKSAVSDLADFLQARAELLERERHALHELLERGSADAIAWRVSKLVGRVESSGGRDTVAVETLRLLDAPENLAPFAQRLLAEDVLPGPYVERVLVRAGHACARALWSARILPKNATPERRARFVSWMLAIGPGAYDVLRAALAKLAPYADTERHATVIEDVLLALPARCDDDLLAFVACFAKSPVARVRELTLSTIARALR